MDVLSNAVRLYLDLVHTAPLLTAMVQFAFLGTFGEVISHWIRLKGFHYPFSARLTLWKMLVWALLGLCIKYAFIGFEGFIVHLTQNGLLPTLGDGILRAFIKSVMINLQFGLFLVLFHRVLDNLVVKEKNWHGLDKGLLSLFWFWIPAHTVTFSLPMDWQIGLAAVWSIALGIILGIYNRY